MPCAHLYIIYYKILIILYIEYNIIIIIKKRKSPCWGRIEAAHGVQIGSLGPRVYMRNEESRKEAEGCVAHTRKERRKQQGLGEASEARTVKELRRKRRNWRQRREAYSEELGEAADWKLGRARSLTHKDAYEQQLKQIYWDPDLF